MRDSRQIVEYNDVTADKYLNTIDGTADIYILI